jgi:hypothetical protein
MNDGVSFKCSVTALATHAQSEGRQLVGNASAPNESGQLLSPPVAPSPDMRSGSWRLVTASIRNSESCVDACVHDPGIFIKTSLLICSDLMTAGDVVKTAPPEE